MLMSLCICYKYIFLFYFVLFGFFLSAALLFVCEWQDEIGLLKLCFFPSWSLITAKQKRKTVESECMLKASLY